MHALIELINDGEPKIVVLSAMSGTTNALVEISQALYQKENEKAGSLIDTLKTKYQQVIEELYKTEVPLQKAKELISTHFDYLQSFTRDLFYYHEERAILCAG